MPIRPIHTRKRRRWPRSFGRRRTETGRTLLELLDESPLLLIFLRHFGCTFCRQTLDDVSRIRALVENAKAFDPFLFTLNRPSGPNPTLTTTFFPNAERVSDPGAALYAFLVFQLPRKKVFSQFLSLPQSGRLGCWE